MQMWSVNYPLYFGNVKMQIVYIGMYLVMTYTEGLISTVWYTFQLIFGSVNCISWVSKLHNSFWPTRKLRQGLI